MLQLNEILKDFFCASYDSNLKVFIDGDYIRYPEKIFVDPSNPYYFIEIVSGKYLIEGKEANINENFINVVTGYLK